MALHSMYMSSSCRPEEASGSLCGGGAFLSSSHDNFVAEALLVVAGSGSGFFSAWCWWLGDIPTGPLTP